MPSDSSHEPKDRGERDRTLRGTEFGRYAGLGLQLAASICLLALGGYWLDGRFGTLPVFLLLGVLVGSIGGTYSLIRKVPPARGARRRDP